jgi:type I restriction enzyme S subunit
MSATPQKPVPQSDDAANDTDLPEGWVEASLEGCATLITKGTTPTSYGFKYQSTGISFVRVENLSNGHIDRSSITTFIGKDADEALKRSRLAVGDLLFSIAGTIGRTALVRAADLPANTNQALAIIRGTGRIFSPQFLRFALASSTAQQQAQSDARGGGMNNISLENVRSFRLPLPPLAEQKRIVAKVEELLTQVNAACNRLAKVPKILKRFRQSVLAAACFGSLTADWRDCHPEIEPAEQLGNGSPPSDIDLPSTWSWLLSACAFNYVTSGSRGWARYYSEEGPLFIRVGNLNHESIELDLRSTQRVSPPKSAEGRRTRVCKGDILVSITADVGMVALVGKDVGEAYINQHVALARPSGNVDSRYLAYFLSAGTGGQRQFLDLQRGATKVGLGLDDIRAIWVARPPLAEQHEIVRRVEALFKVADAMEKRVEAATRRADKLTQAILAKAFRGELVPTEAELARREGRTYEPASILLERIRAERDAR